MRPVHASKHDKQFFEVLFLH